MAKKHRISIDRSALDRVRTVGAQFSNLGFNWGQSHDHPNAQHIVDQRHLKILFDLSRQWDEAIMDVMRSAKPLPSRRQKRVG